MLFRAALLVCCSAFLLACQNPAKPSSDPAPSAIDWSALTLSEAPSAASAESHANSLGWERKNASFYHVWVSAFSDGPDADTVGDLVGLTQKVDEGFFTDLGVNALWLSPIFRASSLAPGSGNKHGYDTTNYNQVDPLYGTLTDLKTLLAHAHNLGIRVIFDFVPNHTSNQHPWFTSGMQNDWYVTRAGVPTGWGGFDSISDWYSFPFGGKYYGVFGSGMPDLNYRNAAVRNEMASVATRWLNVGFDGLRIDAVKYLVEGSSDTQWKDQPETYLWFQALRNRVLDPYTALGSSKFMVSENWESDTANLISYLVKDGKPAFSMTFDFDGASVVNYATSGTGSSLQKDWLTWDLATRPSQLPSGTTFGFFQSNHDNVASRPATAISGANQGPRLFLAAALSLLGKGTPFVYYGNEIGMAGAAGNDIDLRQDYDWARWTAQKSDPASLWTWHSQLLALRTINPAWNDPQVTALTSPVGAFALLLTGATGKRAVVVANLQDAAATSITVNVPGSLALAQTVLGSGQPSQGTGTLTFASLPAFGVRVVALDEASPTVVRATDADGSSYTPVPVVLFLRGTMNAWGKASLVDAGSGLLHQSFSAPSGSPVEFKFGSADWSTALGFAQLDYDSAHDGLAGGLSASLFSASNPDDNVSFTGVVGKTNYEVWIDTNASPRPRYWVTAP